MMKKKITALFLSVLLAVAVLSACGADNETPVATQAPATEAATAAPPTEEPATEAPVIGTPEDYVVTVREYTSTYGGIFTITDEPYREPREVTSRLPQLTIDSEDARAINARIHEGFDGEFDNADTYGVSEYNPRTDYIAHLNGSVLTLVVECRTVNTPNSWFGAYNIDVLTGKELSKDEVLALTNISPEDANARIAADIEDMFSIARESGADDSMLSDPYEQSMSEENLSEAQFYFDADGKLCAAYRYYWFAGASNYGAICKLDAQIR